MKSIGTIRWMLLVLGMSVGAWAQTNTQAPAQPEATPAPAFGQTAPVLNPENPPVTGLDEPSLDLKTASRSFISPALQVSESADSNGENTLGDTSGLASITRVLGALDLQQFWPKSDFLLEYVGGGAFYADPYSVRQLQAAGLEAITRWRTGQITLRDAFSYLPDGSFQIGTFGGAPGLGLATAIGMGTGATGGGLPGINNSSSQTFNGVGIVPRLQNTAILDAVQAITPRSAVTVAGGFSDSHFFDSENCALGPTTCLINSDQLTVEGGYSHLINRHDQLGVVYAFQLFQFPQETGGQIYIHVVNARYSHSITGKLSLILSVGPQYTELEAGGYYKHWSPSARGTLRYRIGHASLVATYEKFTSSGSGFFAGADVQAARLGYTRPLGRTWDLYADIGYTYNSRIQNSLFGAQAGSFNDGFASAILRKHLGRSYEFFAAYRFSELAFDQTVNLGISGTGKIAQRNVGTIGIEWHPRPTRIE
jgi:hypothetical protein